MGADSFASLHLWHDWLEIAETLPLAVLARPGYSLRALGGPAATRFSEAQIPTHLAPRLATARAARLVLHSHAAQAGEFDGDQAAGKGASRHMKGGQVPAP